MLNLNTSEQVAIGAAISTAALATVAAVAWFLGPTEHQRPKSRPLLAPPPRRLPAPSARTSKPRPATRSALAAKSTAPQASVETARAIDPQSKTARKARSKPAAAPITQSEYAPFADYQIKRYRTERVGPTCVTTWSDGETTRMSVATLPGKPFNVGRALRISLTAWESRMQAKRDKAASSRVFAHLMADEIAAIPAKPAVVSCHFERDETIIAKFNPAECNHALGLATAALAA